MPGMLVPAASGGMVSSKVQDLARDVRAGLPLIGWAGDPDLELRVGVLVEMKRQGGRSWPTGRKTGRIEVWFTPTKECIGRWDFEEIDRVCVDLAQMDRRQRGHVPVQDRIRVGNLATERRADDQYQDAMGAMTDHLNSIYQDTVLGKKTFRQVGGRRDG